MKCLFGIADVFGVKDLEEYSKITIDIKDPSYFVIKGKRKDDGSVDKLQQLGRPLCRKTGKPK